MASIFQLNQKMVDFQRMIEEHGAELDEQAIADTLESLEGEITEKLKDYAAVIKNLESDVVGMKAAEKDIATRRKYLENTIERMKSVVDLSMNAHQIERIDDDPRFKIGYRKCAPSVEIVNEDELPDHVFVPQDPAIDKKLLLQLLKDGEKVPGARLVTDKRNFFIK